MTEGGFIPPEQWRGRGAPKVEVPREIREWLDYTYEQNVVRREPIDEDAGEDVARFIRLMNLHAKHRGLVAHHQFVKDERGRRCIQFRMTDRRTYDTSLPRESRR